MSESQTLDPRDTFAGMGKTYQEKVVQALVEDPTFADQMFDVMDPRFFDVEYLKEIAERFFDHKRKYKTFPSLDVIEVMTKSPDIDASTTMQIKDYLSRIRKSPLNGDAAYIRDSSLDFCRKQTMKEALIQAIDHMQESRFDDIATIIKRALAQGASRDLGQEYTDGFAARAQRAVVKRMPTGWGPLDKVFNGGWERGTIATFIAPTGAGKSHVLVNVGAAGVENGLNVVHVTLELADYLIGLRYDSYYSGVEINSIPDHKDDVERSARARVKGRLIIKEWPTKGASVQTLRSYLQRLQVTKGFKADILIVDYADLLRGAGKYTEGRFELKEIYEELRGLAKEFDCAVITADQTNRSGLDLEIVTIAQIGEAYAKATVCDVILTVSRTMEDKQNNTGRLYLPKSRLGRDGMIFPFVMNTSTVRVRLLEESTSVGEIMAAEEGKVRERHSRMVEEMLGRARNAAAAASK